MQLGQIMSIRPSKQIREQVRVAFESNPTHGYKPAELVAKVGLQAGTVAMAVWDLIDAGEIFINKEKRMELTTDETLNASLSV
jgi:hypothetical protein